MGVGALKDWSEIARYVAPGRSFTPDARRHAEYERTYRLWREVYDRLKTLYPQLSTHP
jgi:sugar (pentulose or hexulose) kinase